jgi:putative tricarboxylic transport membrane protein
LTMVGSLSAEFPLKVIIMALIGLILATVGSDEQTGQLRLTFGLNDLVGGVNFIMVALGMFGVAVVLEEAEGIWRSGFAPPRDRLKKGGYWITWSELKQSFMPYVRGTIGGFLLGMLPGIGGMTASIICYGFEKQVSKNPEKFGKGAIEGVAAVESCNNSASQAGLVPLLTLGLPAGASMAFLLGAFIMYGLRPGPLLMETNPQLVWAIIASLYIGNVMLLIMNLPLVNVFAMLLDVPQALLNALVLALCALGAYTRVFSLLELFLMAGFGVFGYFAKKHNYPAAPLLLGLVLGDMLEQGFRRSMAIANGDWTIFFRRPISLVIMIIVVASLVYTFIKFYRHRPDRKDTLGGRTEAY